MSSKKQVWNDGTMGFTPAAVAFATIVRENPELKEEAGSLHQHVSNFRHALKALSTVADGSVRRWVGSLIMKEVSRKILERNSRLSSYADNVVKGEWREWLQAQR